MSRVAICSGGSTRSTAPLAMALCGIPPCWAVDSSCANVSPPAALILAQAQRPVGSGARQHNPDRARSLHRRERSQKVIDRVVRPPVVRTRRDGQKAIGERHVGVRLDHIRAVRHHFGAVLSLDDFDGGARAENAGELAFLMRIQMLNDDQRHSRFVGKRVISFVSASRPPAEAPMPTMGKAVLGSSGHPSSIWPSVPIVLEPLLWGLQRDVPGDFVRIVLGRGPHVPAPLAAVVVHVRRLIDRGQIPESSRESQAGQVGVAGILPTRTFGAPRCRRAILYARI
jgi:hypothetical protein